jgi:hypothetical protein
MPEDPKSLADLRVETLIGLIGGSASAPGAGAAGAVTLALAAACAAKAVSITLRHLPANHPLTEALERLRRLSELALCGGDADSRAFMDFIRHKSAGPAAELVDLGEAMAQLIHTLEALIAEIEPHICAVMAGDLIAAKALAAAARRIQSANENEAEAERRRQ